jgi:hypothetical protein
MVVQLPGRRRQRRRGGAPNEDRGQRSADTSDPKVQAHRKPIDIDGGSEHYYMAGAEGTQEVRVPPADANTTTSREGSSAIPTPPEPDPRPEPPPPIPVPEPGPDPPPTNPIPPPPPAVAVRHRRRRSD